MKNEDPAYNGNLLGHVRPVTQHLFWCALLTPLCCTGLTCVCLAWLERRRHLLSAATPQGGWGRLTHPGATRWGWNGDAQDTGGIVGPDWFTVRARRHSACNIDKTRSGSARCSAAWPVRCTQNVWAQCVQRDDGGRKSARRLVC